MGYCAEPTPEMGPYSVETRRESFRLFGEDAYEYVTGATDEEPQHVIYTDPIASNSVKGRGGIGVVEFMMEDIPFIRAALDQVEAIEARPSNMSRRPELVCDTCGYWLDEGDHSHPPPDFSTVMFPAPVDDLVDA